ncbi:MAG: hypothetical protein ABSD10_00285 [Candidatus Saccharimonadales bacterium]
MYEPITDTQKARIGSALTERIGQAVIVDKLANRSRNFWIFSFEEPEAVIDSEGTIPQYMIVASEGDMGATRWFRVLVKKTGLGSGTPKTEAYRVEMLKNTQFAAKVSKATVRLDHVDATIEDSGEDQDDLEVGYVVAAVSGGLTPAAQSYSDVMESELGSQWALGECSSDEAEHFADLLINSKVSDLSLPDLATGNY